MKEEKFMIEWEGAVAKDNVHGCNWMGGHAESRDGEDVELEAEYLAPDSWIGKTPEEIDQKEADRWDDESYEWLKKEIIRQAEENNVDVSRLQFPYDD